MTGKEVFMDVTTIIIMTLAFRLMFQSNGMFLTSCFLFGIFMGIRAGLRTIDKDKK